MSVERYASNQEVRTNQKSYGDVHSSSKTLVKRGFNESVPEPLLYRVFGLGIEAGTSEDSCIRCGMAYTGLL